MYIGIGDGIAGEMRNVRRSEPQRLDIVTGKILRISPDLRGNVSTSTLSSNGRYRIPNDNPFVGVQDARKEIWAVGFRNPHRMIWNVTPGRSQPDLIAFSIGSNKWEAIDVVHKGANYGYPVREGAQVRTLNGYEALPANDQLPWLLNETATQGVVKPTYPALTYATGVTGDAIAGGQIYTGTRIAALRGKLIFGDITSGRIWYTDVAELLKADDGDPATMAAMYPISTDLREAIDKTYHARGGQGLIPGSAPFGGPGRLDIRFATDADGGIFITSKADGMIRKVVGVR
jgi:glucose/arabinose dehydrogenase